MPKIRKKVSLVFLLIFFLNTKAFGVPIKYISGIPEIKDAAVFYFENIGNIRLYSVISFSTDKICKEIKTNKQVYCGKLFKKQMEELIGNSEIECFYKGVGPFGKMMYKCINWENKDLTYEALKRGLVILYTYEFAKEEYKEAENYAKKNKLGIWSMVEGKNILEIREKMKYIYDRNLLR